MKLITQVMIFCMTGALLIPLELGAANTKNEISYAQEHLTVHVVEVSLKQVLSAVAKETKLEFVLNETIAAKKVSVSFDRVPLEKGIKRIIRPLSCSMIFDSSGMLKKVIILKSGSRSANVTISGDPDSESSGPFSSQEDFDPSLGPAGQLDEEIPPNTPGLGPGGEMAISSEGEDYDPSLGPAGRLDEEIPPNTPGLGPGGEMAISSQEEDYDPSLGPTGQPDEGPISNASGPGQ
jgi:hypothetical protein